MPISLRENITSQRRLPQNEELLKGRAQMLGERDRLLMEAVLIRGQSAESLAKLMGASSRMIRFRVHRLGQRLASRRFLDVVRALPYLSPTDGRLARMRYCEGLSQRQICQQLSLTPHQLRRHLDIIAGQIAAIGRQSRQSASWRTQTPSAQQVAHLAQM